MRTNPLFNLFHSKQVDNWMKKGKNTTFGSFTIVCVHTETDFLWNVVARARLFVYATVRDIKFVSVISYVHWVI